LAGPLLPDQPPHEGLCLVGKKVVVRELRNGTIQLVGKGQKLECTELPQRPVPSPVPKPSWPKRPVAVKPASTHPWRQSLSGIGKGREFWRKVKAAGRAARKASRTRREAGA